ncbi:MAG: YeeE/YedE family protein, partial [Vicinamibacteria bacterium]|nr:YeeE/YedE family protein [Vicinamibacteria bacterium]
ARNALQHSTLWMLIGTLLGGALSGWLHGRMSVVIHRGPRIGPGARLALAFLGGAIMGFGARLARGCTSGQALSGGAVLSVGSFAFMFSIFGSAYALAYFLRREWT